MSETQGVVAIIIDNHGQVLSSVSDFDAAGYGGFTKEQGQKLRVRDAVYTQFCKDFFPAFVSANLEHYTKARIVEDLVRREKIKIHYQLIGYETNETE